MELEALESREPEKGGFIEVHPPHGFWFWGLTFIYPRPAIMRSPNRERQHQQSAMLFFCRLLLVVSNPNTARKLQKQDITRPPLEL